MFVITIEDFDRLLLLAEGRADKIGYDIDHDPHYRWITEVVMNCDYYGRNCDAQERRQLLYSFYQLFDKIGLSFSGEL